MFNMMFTEGEYNNKFLKVKHFHIFIIPHQVNHFIFKKTHVTCFGNLTSSLTHISASIVLSSGVGPSSYDVVVSDLHPVRSQNLHQSPCSRLPPFACTFET